MKCLTIKMWAKLHGSNVAESLLKDFQNYCEEMLFKYLLVKITIGTFNRANSPIKLLITKINVT